MSGTVCSSQSLPPFNMAAFIRYFKNHFEINFYLRSEEIVLRKIRF